MKINFQNLRKLYVFYVMFKNITFLNRIEFITFIMVQRIGGNRRKSRAKMRKPVSQRGKISITSYLAKYNDGDRVQLKAEPAIQKGIYHLNFHGKSGIVKGMQGNCYKVYVKDGDKDKCLLVHPVHLAKL